jgi:hypothetical protein
MPDPHRSASELSCAPARACMSGGVMPYMPVQAVYNLFMWAEALKVWGGARMGHLGVSVPCRSFHGG